MRLEYAEKLGIIQIANCKRLYNLKSPFNCLRDGFEFVQHSMSVIEVIYNDCYDTKFCGDDYALRKLGLKNACNCPKVKLTHCLLYENGGVHWKSQDRFHFKRHDPSCNRQRIEAVALPYPHNFLRFMFLRQAIHLETRIHDRTNSRSYCRINEQSRLALLNSNQWIRIT